MARMQTNNALYFPLDVNFFNDVKIRRLDREYPNKGPLAYIYLISQVYSDKRGYCTALSESIIFDLSDKVHIGEVEAMNMIIRMIEIGLFDREVYNKLNILTSKAIQLRFQEIVRKKGRKTAVRVEKQCWLIAEEETMPYIEMVSREENSSGKKAINKIKEKEKKEDKNKEEERKGEQSAAADLIKEYEKCIGKTSVNVKSGIENYLNQGVEDKLISRLIQYALEQGKLSWQYVDAAISGNISEGIRTLDEYLSRRKGAKKKGFNNYIDTNKPDYSDFREQIIADMLREGSEPEKKTEERSE